MAILNKEFGLIDQLIATAPYTTKQEKEMVALGELLSTQIFEAYLQEEGVDSFLLPALDFMVIDADNEPILSQIELNLTKVMAPIKNKQIFITQGFICRNPAGEVDNLKRGGSDYTASLIGGASKPRKFKFGRTSMGCTTMILESLKIPSRFVNCHLLRRLNSLILALKFYIQVRLRLPK